MILKVAVSTLLVLGGLVAGRTLPQDEQEDQKMKEMMEAWEKAATPGEQHKALAALAGKWEQKGQFESMFGKATWTGTTTYRPILGGRFIVAEGSAKMEGDGMPPTDFQTFQIIGYDNVSQKYQTVWLDSMGTMMYFSPGTAEESGKISYEAPMRDSMSPEGRPFKVVVIPQGPDKQTVELWDSKADQKTLVKEGTIVETRVK
jgi:hypothetical protein